jgi:hypothetical protein
VTALTQGERDELARTAGLLDGAEGPVPADVLPPEARLRTALEELLARRGRVLVTVDRGDELRWVTTTVADPLADELASAGLGLLSARERVALALVLLRTVVLPAAHGRPPTCWSDAPRVLVRDVRDAAINVPNQHITDALQSLALRGLIDFAPAAGVRPGRALERLTPRSRARIERDLVAIVAGDNPLIARVLDRLAAEDPRPTHAGETP